MRIGRHDTTLDLDIEGYQFPFFRSPEDFDYDANWLNIVGEVRRSDGDSWRFRDPCLTTWEAKALLTWLRAVIASADPIDPPQFIEPNVSFAVGHNGKSQVTLLVTLSQESAEPPIVKRGSKETQLSLVTDKQQLREAVTALEQQIATFPPR